MNLRRGVLHGGKSDLVVSEVKDGVEGRDEYITPTINKLLE